MAKKADVLIQKKKELDTYVSKAREAISLVTDTISKLGVINENIESKIREIDEYQAELDATKNGLTDAKTKNELIINNFNALLNDK